MNKSQNILSDITVYNKYARYIGDKQRRETWEELCDRNMAMHIQKAPELEDEIRFVYNEYVKTKKVLPSMRSLQFGGRPIEISPNRIYNCSFDHCDSIEFFSETMFNLLSGTGVGYSVQSKHVSKLPYIKKPVKNKNGEYRRRRYLIGDSIEGWADAVKMLIRAYFEGKYIPNFDFRDIRPKGAKLVTSGGKAPGPEPLRNCLQNIKNLLDTKSDGDKLTPIECHDIICHIADAVLAGGIRRAALISLFDFDDFDMRACKSNWTFESLEYVNERIYIDEHGNKIPSEKLQAQEATGITPKDWQVIETPIMVELNGVKYYDLKIKGIDSPGYGKVDKTAHFVSEAEVENFKKTGKIAWYYFEPHRGRANNSAVMLRHMVTKKDFFELWEYAKESQAGEPGIFFSNDADWGANPCCEISLRPKQFCNLTEINAANIESEDDFKQRAKAAAFIGTLQASYTDFHYLREGWRETTEKEALIGVGMTGIANNIVTKYSLSDAAEIVKQENERVAKILNINKAARTTCIKPSGTTSCVLGCSSGIHGWHSNYYIRRMRIGKNESLYTYFKIHHPELIEDDFFNADKQAVISIPQMAPKDAILRTESPIDLLNRINRFYKEWVKIGHRKGMNINNVSATVSIKDDEWDVVGNHIWEKREEITGISVLPYDGGTYIQAPFEDIDEETYNKMYNALHDIDLTKVIEVEDNTDLAGELACAGGACEVV